MLPSLLKCFLTAALASAALAASATGKEAEPTRILDSAMADRLMANQGVTLQWIDWNQRGSALVSDRDGVWTLRASQSEIDGPGSLFLDGRIIEIGSDYFLFNRTVQINGTPDSGRRYQKRDIWRFAITQNRPYWRIRQFEWCDDLTDYIDIYFQEDTPASPPGFRR